MSSSKALRTVRPPKPESKTPMVGRRDCAPEGPEAPEERSALIHLISREAATRLNLFEVLHQLVVGPASATAGPRRNRRSMRASARVPKEGAYFVRRFRRKDVL